MNEPPWPTPPDHRPAVRLNVAQSADGKISPVSGGKVNFGGPVDRQRMERLRGSADAVLIGGGTLRVEDPPLLVRDPELRARRLANHQPPHPLNVTVASVLPENLAASRFFTHPETDRLVLTTPRTPAAHIDAARRLERVRVLVVDPTPEGSVDLRLAMARLRASGVERLMLEGGGALNFAMLAADLVDELFATLCPFVFGGKTAPTPVDGPGFPTSQVRQLALIGHHAGPRGELFLHYRVLTSRPAVRPNRLFPDAFEIEPASDS